MKSQKLPLAYLKGSNRVWTPTWKANAAAAKRQQVWMLTCSTNTFCLPLRLSSKTLRWLTFCSRKAGAVWLQSSVLSVGHEATPHRNTICTLIELNHLEFSGATRRSYTLSGGIGILACSWRRHRKPGCCLTIRDMSCRSPFHMMLRFQAGCMSVKSRTSSSIFSTLLCRPASCDGCSVVS